MELTDQFFAETDEGDEYQVLVYQRAVSFRPLSGPRQQLGGARDYRLADGRDLNPISDDVFEIVETGQILRRVG